MMAVLTRILARYLAGALVLYGMTDPGTAEALHPDLALLAGAILGALAEAAYAMAHRLGWRT